MILVLLAAPLSASVAESAPTAEELDAAIANRAAYGLTTSSADVLALMGSPTDVGTAEWGIPLTADESAALDLATRMEFEVEAKDVVAYARSVPEFGGAYFDRLGGGGLVLQFTKASDSTIQRVSELAPKKSLTTKLETVQYSFATLVQAMLAAPATVRQLQPTVEVVSVGISEPDNAIIVTILDNGQDTVSLAAEATGLLGIPVTVDVVSSPLELGSCARSNCIGPTRAGINIGDGPEGCTMGFHVVNSSLDKQFVTAGHCGAGTWYHSSPSNPVLLLGTVQSELYPATAIDVERIQFPNAQASTLIYGEGSRAITGWDWPVANATVCASLGKTDLVTCSGTVYVAVGVYHANGYGLVGTDVHGIVTKGGDSGSPLYLRGANNSALGLGIYSAGYPGGPSADRWWARIGDALTYQTWSGWDIYH